MKTFYLLFFLPSLLFSPQAYSEENPCARMGIRSSQDVKPIKEHDGLILWYRQKEYTLVDPQGDLFLSYQAWVTFKNFSKKALGKNTDWQKRAEGFLAAQACGEFLWGKQHVPQLLNKAVKEQSEAIDKEIEKLKLLDPLRRKKYEDQIRLGHLYLEGHKPSIKRAEFLNMLKMVMIEEYQRSGLVPKMGEVHEYNPEQFSTLLSEWKDLNGAKVFQIPLSFFSKVLTCLAMGVCSRYLVSGHEDELRFWLNSQANHSISPAQLFKRSYLINTGDVYLSLLTIENVLSAHWRILERERIDFVNRLMPIINHLGPGFDHYGSWYHLWGIMLYGYASSHTRAWLVAQTESLGSHILDKYADEKQEDYINEDGALIGGELNEAMKEFVHPHAARWRPWQVKDALEKGRYYRLAPWLKEKFNPKALEPNFYLDLAEEFSDRLSKNLANLPKTLDYMTPKTPKPPIRLELFNN